MEQDLAVHLLFLNGSLNLKKNEDENDLKINDRKHDMFCTLASGFHCLLIANYCADLHFGKSHN